MDAGEVQVDPVHDEFFKMQDLVDALVREAIQNSLDARRGSSRVRVKFTFGTGAAALPAEAAREYFRGLREHLTQVGGSLQAALPQANEPVPYLLIEDFGTRGLTGDPSIDPELEPTNETKNDFFYFWRNVGRSNKGEVDRGRWGLGKAVFSVASRIRTIFGLTRRADDARSLLLGQSVLKTHIVNGVRRYPYGFFAHYLKKDGLPLPIEDPLLLERFFDDFRLGRTEPGLSVIVPYYRDDELSFEKIIESSIRQYFYPMTKGDLQVELVDGSRTEVINSKSIDDVGARYSGGAASEIRRLADLTRWALASSDDKRIDISAQKAPAPKWADDLFGSSLDELRERFERGDRIAIRAQVYIKKKRSSVPARGTFDLYIEKDESLRKPNVHFIRRSITVPDVKHSVDKPARVLVVIEDKELSSFLGDAENPAHSDWSERADKLRTTYDHHASTLRFIKNSASAVASLLSRPPEGRVRDFLQDIFSIDAPDDDAAASTAARIPIKKNDAGESDGTGSAKSTEGAPATIARVGEGFTLRGTGDERWVGQPLTAEVAYRVRTGNPFAKHSNFDFDLSSAEIDIVTTGVQLQMRERNELKFIIDSPKFQITVKGFDPDRDLVVRVTEPSGHASEA